MNRINVNSALAAFVPAVMTTLLIQACGGSSEAVAQAPAVAEAEPLEGVWESAVTIRDCASGAAVRTFKGLGVFHRGGTATATNNQPAASNGPAFGTWTRTAAGPGYTATFRFYRFNPDGTFAGAQKLVRTMTMGAGGNSFSATISAQVLDPSDTVVQSVCGTETANKVV